MDNNVTHGYGSNNHIMFSWYDYILFTLMLALSALIGIYFGFFAKNKQTTADEYLLGGKQMKVIPIALSLVASAISGTTLLAVPTDIYRYGSTYVFICVGSCLVLYIAYKVYIPVFHKLQLFSTYAYLELRFNKQLRIFSSLLFTAGGVLAIPMVVYAPALAFAQATGVNVYTIAALISIVCVFYTTIGGLKAVVWTDALQFILMVGAVLIVLFLGISSIGGIGEVFRRAYEGGRISYDLDIDPTKRDTVWTILIGSQFLNIGFICIGQSCVQKYLALPTMKDVRTALWLFMIGATLMTLISVITGIIVYARYADCDPLAEGKIKKIDQILPLYIMEIAENVPGLAGLYISGLISAGLSTLSAIMNCLAGTVYEDFISPLMPKDTSQQTISRILKLTVIIVGVVGTALILLFDKLGNILQIQYSLIGISSGPLVGLFTLGMLVPMANSKGAMAGGISSLAIMSMIIVKAQIYQAQGLISYPSKPISVEGCENFVNTTITTTIYKVVDPELLPFVIFRISYWYYALMGFLIVFLVAIPVSYITKSKTDKPVDRDLITPCMQWCLKEESLIEENMYYSVDKALKIVYGEDNNTQVSQNEKTL